MAHKINDNGTEREMSADEETAYLAWLEDIKAEEKIKADAIAAKAAAKANALAKLGLTADEAAALFG